MSDAPRKTLREALEEIANHPHSMDAPGQPYGGDGVLNYRQGIIDGHRCAATIARETLALAAPDPLPAGPLLVVVESPYAGDVERNVAYAKACMLDCLRRGEAPFASHLLYTLVLDDLDADQRQQGIDAGLAWGDRAAATVVYADHGISRGMEIGIARAQAAGRPGEFRRLPENSSGAAPSAFASTGGPAPVAGESGHQEAAAGDVPPQLAKVALSAALAATESALADAVIEKLRRERDKARAELDNLAMAVGVSARTEGIVVEHRMSWSDLAERWLEERQMLKATEKDLKLTTEQMWLVSGERDAARADRDKIRAELSAAQAHAARLEGALREAKAEALEAAAREVGDNPPLDKVSVYSLVTWLISRAAAARKEEGVLAKVVQRVEDRAAMDQPPAPIEAGKGEGE